MYFMTTLKQQLSVQTSQRALEQQLQLKSFVRVALRPRQSRNATLSLVSCQMGSGGKEEETTLQLSEWHAVKAIQRRPAHAGKYLKGRREELTSSVNAWIMALTKGDAVKARDALLKALEPQEREYCGGIEWMCRRSARWSGQ